MSKYTTEVRYICETLAGLTESEGYNSVDNILTESAPKIFDFEFPIFDENYRLPLEKKILRHFYTREICEETYGLWKLRLEDKLNLIMPYYNQLYKSELLEFNPLYDVDITRDFNRNNSGENNTTDTGTTTLTGTHTRTGTQTVDTDTTNKNTSETTNKTTNEGETTTARNTSNTIETTTKNTIDTDTTDSLTRNSTTTRDLTNDKTTSGTNNDDRWELYSDTPQGGLTGIGEITDPNPAQGDLGYLSSVKHILDKATNTGTDKIVETGTDVLNGTDTGKGTVDTTENGTANTTNTGTDNTTVNDSNTVNVTGSVTDNDTGTEDTTVTDNFTNNDNVTNEISNTGKSTISNTEQYIEHVKGKQGSGSYSQMLLDFRKTFLNIDGMLLEELSTLFFGLWN